MAAKKGTKHHGIMDLLAANPCGLRQSDIAKKFRLAGCSTLTAMRRQDLIAKAGAALRTPWVITDKGKQVLATLGPYTVECARCGASTNGRLCDACLQTEVEEASADLINPDYDNPTAFEWKRTK